MGDGGESNVAMLDICSGCPNIKESRLNILIFLLVEDLRSLIISIPYRHVLIAACDNYVKMPVYSANT